MNVLQKTVGEVMLLKANSLYMVSKLNFLYVQFSNAGVFSKYLTKHISFSQLSDVIILLCLAYKISLHSPDLSFP